MCHYGRRYVWVYVTARVTRPPPRTVWFHVKNSIAAWTRRSAHQCAAHVDSGRDSVLRGRWSANSSTRPGN